MMEPIARLDDEHRVLEGCVARLECLLTTSHHPFDLRTFAVLLDQLAQRLPEHLRFEETQFYVPLTALHPATYEVLQQLMRDHEDLMQTLRQLQELQFEHPPLAEVALHAYSTHFVELYREHSEREHRCLFPLLEQLPATPLPPADHAPALAHAARVPARRLAHR